MARPLARFKDSNGQYYQDEWQPYVLSSLVNRVTRKNSENQTNIPLTMSARDGLIDQESYFNKTVASSDLSNYTLLYQGEFAYNHSSSKGYDYGAIHRLTKVSCGAVTPLYFCFNIKDQANIDSDFLAYYFESQKWTREVASICSKGARQHGALNISVDDFFNIIIYVPSIEEQRQVVRIASSIDTTINQMESIVDAWEQRKKGVTQKLFSQEVRFKADDGSDYPDWQNVNLNELGRLTSGNGFNLKYQGHTDKPIYFYKVSDMNLPQNYKEMVTAQNTVDDDILKLMKIKPITSPSIIFAKVGMAIHAERKRTVNKPFCMDNNMMAFTPKSDVNFNFCYWLTQTLTFAKHAQPGSPPSLTATIIGNLPVSIPSSIEEQRKIAECLDAIDDVIALSKAELEKWRELKQGLLQQLFV